ncbi:MULTISPECIES: isochorismatase family protein [Paenibacillus]|uniref:Isochorismatase-like domain-containing protein n=2 Tax=Paenibacillus TaxID=44249 RepID=A0A919Y4P7_9BACL|nr:MULTISPECIES: isochorismatase family protein [Paenibacillus]GIO37354.1 hypothetical protein J41TS12_22150 [Paenibacillus antibioticophila]GIO43724.1 hypothetical protein J41TS4_34820 [Paenibacillus apis]
MNPALLIIDLQEGHIPGPRKRGEVEEVCMYINYVSSLFRDAGKPIVVIQDIEVEGGIDSEDFAVIPEIELTGGELILHKEWSNAFWKTNLEDVLRQEGVDFVIVCGFAAEHCVTFTYNGAKERGFGAAYLQNGLLGEHPNAVQAVTEVRPLISYPVIASILKS